MRIFEAQFPPPPDPPLPSPPQPPPPQPPPPQPPPCPPCPPCPPPPPPPPPCITMRSRGCLGAAKLEQLMGSQKMVMYECKQPEGGRCGHHGSHPDTTPSALLAPECWKTSRLLFAREARGSCVAVRSSRPVGRGRVPTWQRNHAASRGPGHRWVALQSPDRRAPRPSKLWSRRAGRNLGADVHAVPPRLVRFSVARSKQEHSGEPRRGGIAPSHWEPGASCPWGVHEWATDPRKGTTCGRTSSLCTKAAMWPRPGMTTVLPS
jgi:hypothetical protein